MILDVAYICDAWNTHLKEDGRSVTLSDTAGNQLNREQIDDTANRVHAWLKKNGLGKEDFVLINLDRGVKTMMAMLGVIKNASAFTIVESTYATDRIAFIKEDCHAKAEICEQNWPEIMQTEPIAEYTPADDHDVCCSVYTSGTTGTPKGVIHEYGQLKLEMMSERWPDGTWKENRETRWALVAPMNFVASLKIFVHVLYSGAHLFVLDYDTVKNPKKLTLYFLKNRINGTFLSPSLLRLKGGDLGPFMKSVYTGSEPANNLFVKGVELGNTYVMSESFFTVCKFIIDKSYPVCPIGQPRFPLDIRLINEKGEAVAEGETGELCFENPFCRGYINNPEENQRHFVDGYFHTGDLAAFVDGRYVLKGRSDDMIKIDGNRIEPSEIEAVCKEEMKATVCIAKGYEAEGFVALYYMGVDSFNEEELHQRLEKRLPYYMIPTYFIKIDAVPLTPSGKMNRKALSMPKDFFRQPYVAPRDDFERKLCAAAEKLLELKDIGIKDDFFKLGGTSIKAMELLSEMDDELLTPTMVYKGRTIEKISDLYQKAKANFMTQEEKELEGRKHQYPLSKNMLWYWNNVNDGSLDFFNAYKLTLLVPPHLLVNRINKFIAKNSTFNLILKTGKGGVPVQCYTPKTPFVHLEYMSEAEVEQLRKTFVRPFGLEEPLIRIRVIKTFAHVYVFFHAFHMITDGAGMHFMLEDIRKCIFGHETEEVRYFAWALEENIRNESETVEENKKYFHQHYFDPDYDIAIRSDINTGMHGSAKTDAATINLMTVQNYCQKEQISVNNFLIAVALLVQSAYNHKNEQLLIWNFNNRGPKDNRAGMMVRAAFCTMHRNQIQDVKDLYRSIMRQNEDTLWRVYDYDFFVDFEKTNLMPDITLTYLEDWFTTGIFPRLIGTEIALENTSAAGEESEKFYCLACTHEDGNLCLTLQYGLSYLKPSSANRYIAMLEFCMNELVQNRLPDFSAFDEKE